MEFGLELNESSRSFAILILVLNAHKQIDRDIFPYLRFWIEFIVCIHTHTQNFVEFLPFVLVFIFVCCFFFRQYFDWISILCWSSNDGKSGLLSTVFYSVMMADIWLCQSICRVLYHQSVYVVAKAGITMPTKYVDQWITCE